MSKRWLNNFIAVCVVVLYMALLLVTAGCSGQGVRLDVETQNDKCGTKNVSFSTDYQVEQLEIGRTIEGGGTDGGGSEGCGGGYTVTLGKGTTKDAELGLISELLQMVRVLAGGGVNPQTQAMETVIKNSARMNITPVAGPVPLEGGLDTSTPIQMDKAGNVWINGRINPKLPLGRE